MKSDKQIFEDTSDFAERLDRLDPLRKYRDEFFHAEPDMIYLDGNSLGKMPMKTLERMEHVTRYEWGTRLIRSWNEGWYERSVNTGASLSRLLGAQKDEVVIADSTSVNLYKLAHAALRYNKGRRKIVSDVFNFPTDLYIMQGIIDELGGDHQLELIESRDNIHIEKEDIEKHIDEDTALVILSLVAFKSAYLYDMEMVNELAHRRSALVLWDLSHAAGSVPVDLNGTGADLAVGCTYKYLNGGPGSPAFLYVRKDLQDKISPPVWGWFGDADPFAFNLQYAPSDNIRKFLTGTPPILSLSTIESALNIIHCAGMTSIRKKSLHQSSYLIYLIEKLLSPLGFRIGSPSDPVSRGSHIALLHEEAWRICQSMINPKENILKIIPDFRHPDVIRLGITPLYTSYMDLYITVERIRQIVEDREYEEFPFEKGGVT